jgi:hypothetical protein
MKNHPEVKSAVNDTAESQGPNPAQSAGGAADDGVSDAPKLSRASLVAAGAASASMSHSLQAHSGPSAKAGPLVAGVPDGSRQRTVSSTLPSSQKMTGAMSTTNGETTLNGKVADHAHPSLEMFMQIQATTRMLLEVHQSQQRVVERFLETQERMLACCMQGMAGLPALARAPAAPVPVSAPAPAALEPAPAAVPSRVIPSPARPAVPMPPREAPSRRVVSPPPPLGNRKAPIAATAAVAAPPTPSPAPRTQEVLKVAPAAAIVAVEGPPPVENFRHDLLRIVSERTGYPLDMLDENLPLEAGLGIDSIKTVEIFSKLKEYHVYFREGVQDEEELLAEFTRLKTLQDIIDSYDRHRAAFHAAPSNGQNGSTHHSHAGEKKPISAVERFAVTATEVPLEGNGAKKDFLSATSS